MANGHEIRREYDARSGEPRFPRDPRAYLEDWAAADAGHLRRFYPQGDHEVHYEVTPAFEKRVAELVGKRAKLYRSLAK